METSLGYKSELKASLNCIARPYLKKTKKQKQKTLESLADCRKTQIMLILKFELTYKILPKGKE